MACINSKQGRNCELFRNALMKRVVLWYLIYTSICRRGRKTIMCQVVVDIPNEVLYDTHMGSADAAAFVKQMVALGYYTQNNVSIGYCAKIAGMTEGEFIAFLGRNEVSIFRFENGEELARDYANA